MDAYDTTRDARSAARYDDDPQAEPDTREVKDTLAQMGLGAQESAAEGTGYRG